jgi:hypothetical protein
MSKNDKKYFHKTLAMSNDIIFRGAGGLTTFGRRDYI